VFSFFRRKSAPDEPVADTVSTAEEEFDFSALTRSGPPQPGTEDRGSADPSGAGTLDAAPPADPALDDALRPKIIAAASSVFDPEIPVNIYELGLIYDVAIRADRRVFITMTLTSPMCPSAQQLPSEVEWKVKAVEGVTDAKVEIVWDPPWTAEKMTEAARLQLGLL
jgi:FeS assembly SUF system protein